MSTEPRTAANDPAPATETAGDLVPVGLRGIQRTDPLAGGASLTVISDSGSPVLGYGTLGGIAFDAAGGSPLALTAAHVLGQQVGKLVIEPFGGPPALLDAVVDLIRGSSTEAPPLDVVAPAPFAPAVALAAAASWIQTVALNDVSGQTAQAGQRAHHRALEGRDLEDPSRFGQRTTSVPPATRTDAEEIEVIAQAPAFPFAGRFVAPSVACAYRRHASTGIFEQAITHGRPNTGALVHKRVWTNSRKYRRGQKVTVGAELFPADPLGSGVRNHFVVAHFFPLTSPSAVIRRVLEPGTAPEPADSKVSFRGFPAPAKDGQSAPFPLVVGPFRWNADRPGVWEGRLPPGVPSGAVALRLPDTSVRLLVPPSTRVEIEVLHRGTGMTATPSAASGMQLPPARTTVGPDALQTLIVTGIEIVEATLESGGGPGLVLGVMASRARPSPPAAPVGYAGGFELPSAAGQGPWGVAVFAQTLYQTPFPSAEGIIGAGRVAGITETANMVEGPRATAELLVDAVFDVT